MQEVFGVNDHIREVARLWAQLGYTVLAPDIFWRLQPGIELGYSPETYQQGRDLKAKTDIALAIGDLKEALVKLRSQPTCHGKVGAVGYCMGGTFAYLMATEAEVDAAVCYYGSNIDEHLHVAHKLHRPIMMHFGVTDQRLTPDKVAKITEAVGAKPDVEIHIYDAGHAFNRDCSHEYDRHSAMLAFGRSTAFLYRFTAPHQKISEHSGSQTTSASPR